MPKPTVPENSNIVKCPECNDIREAGINVCDCDVDAEPCLALTQSEIDAMLADAHQANELLRVRVAELEKALEPFANAAASWGPGDASRILSRVRRGYETQPDLCVTVGHLLDTQRALGGDK